jgi:hypothetical protein
MAGRRGFLGTFDAIIYPSECGFHGTLLGRHWRDWKGDWEVS